MRCSSGLLAPLVGRQPLSGSRDCLPHLGRGTHLHFLLSSCPSCWRGLRPSQLCSSLQLKLRDLATPRERVSRKRVTGQIQICIHIVVAAQSVVCLRRRVRTQGLARMRQVKKERPAAIFSLTLQVEHSLSRATPHIWRPACGNHRDRRSLRRGRSARPAVVHQRTQLLSKTH